MRLLCWLFGHRLRRLRVADRVGGVACVRCWRSCCLPEPGVSEEEADAAGWP